MGSDPITDTVEVVSCPDLCSPPAERSGYVSSNPGASIKILMRPIRLQDGVNWR